MVCYTIATPCWHPQVSIQVRRRKKKKKKLKDSSSKDDKEGHIDTTLFISTLLFLQVGLDVAGQIRVLAFYISDEGSEKSGYHLLWSFSPLISSLFFFFLIKTNKNKTNKILLFITESEWFVMGETLRIISFQPLPRAGTSPTRSGHPIYGLAFSSVMLVPK